MRKTNIFGVIGFAAVMFFIGSGIVLSQEAITGEWTADARQEKGGANKIHLSFERKTERGKSQNGSSYAYEDLQGLSRSDTENGRVNFKLAREAGTIECEGSFSNGKGSGTFRFVPNTGFVDAMRSRGFDMTTSTSKGGRDSVEERLFMATTINVTTALADDLRSANFPNLGFEDLVKAAIFKIDGKFMAEMKATGFANLGMEDLVKARIFKIDADFVRKTREMGFGTDNFENLVKFSIFKVTPEFLAELKTEGLTDLTSEDVVKLRIFKIDAAYIRDARASEPNITVEQLVQKRIGVRR